MITEKLWVKRRQSNRSSGRGPFGFRLTLARRDALAGLVFVAPQTLGYAIFILGPLISIFWFSLHDWNIVLGNFDFIGLDNYRAFGDDPQVARVARNSLVFALGYVPVTVMAGLALAVAVNSKLRGMKSFRIIYFLPVVISLAAWTIVWRLILQPDGPLNAFLQVVGVDGRPWLRESGFAMASAIVVQYFKTVGFSMILFLAGLQGVPKEYRDASNQALFANTKTTVVPPKPTPITCNTLVGIDDRRHRNASRDSPADLHELCEVHQSPVLDPQVHAGNHVAAGVNRFEAAQLREPRGKDGVGFRDDGYARRPQQLSQPGTLGAGALLSVRLRLFTRERGRATRGHPTGQDGGPLNELPARRRSHAILQGVWRRPIPGGLPTRTPADAPGNRAAALVYDCEQRPGAAAAVLGRPDPTRGV